MTTCGPEEEIREIREIREIAANHAKALLMGRHRRGRYRVHAVGV
jgi:hypothetical protein